MKVFWLCVCVCVCVCGCMILTKQKTSREGEGDEEVFCFWFVFLIFFGWVSREVCFRVVGSAGRSPSSSHDVRLESCFFKLLILGQIIRRGGGSLVQQICLSWIMLPTMTLEILSLSPWLPLHRTGKNRFCMFLFFRQPLF